MKIISLKTNNILKLRAISIDCDGKSVTLKGKNGAGKTSVMRSIEMALAGAGAIAQKPIHGDEEDGRIVLNLGDFIVTRMFHKTNSQTTLTVTSKEGAVFPKAQSMLDALCAKLSFDPMEFARLGTGDADDKAKQLKTLKNIVGLDFSELDMKRKGLYDERTMVGRDLKAAEGKISGKIAYEGLPAEPVSVSALADELNKAQIHNNSIEERRRVLRNNEAGLEQDRQNLATAKQEIVDLEAKLSALKQAVETMVKLGKARVAELKGEAETIAALKPVDTAAIQQKIANSEATNADIRFNQQLATDTKSVETYKAKSDDLTKKIDAIDADKEKQLKEAKFPLKGLGFSDTGVTLDGIPFDQCSTGDQIRASCAIGIALNPKLRVLLVRDGSLLDSGKLKMLAELAHEHDVQLWIESVSDDEDVRVEIEGEGEAK